MMPTLESEPTSSYILWESFNLSHPRPITQGIATCQTITSVGEDEIPYTAGGNVKWCSQFENSLAIPRMITLIVTIQTQQFHS